MEKLRAELEQVRTASEALLRQTIDKPSGQPDLVHIVWFKLKDDIQQNGVEELIKKIDKLKEIPEVHALEVGRFHDLEDPRAMSEFGLVMSMRFETDQDYRAYQAHPIHVELKTLVKDYLSGPPVTYDYLATH